MVAVARRLNGDEFLSTAYQTDAIKEGETRVQVKLYYEPEMELLTIFWQPPRKNQIAIELGDGVILIYKNALNCYIFL
ncbi:hypothetical protein J0895_11775 [Phormidium pseudopriestleyi FRX01]|uniref:Uncharacterized protein n=1 Tax=Phormidium pseudopriestleyi FRX01 TaxID=1759528 RepID=A0ABS3FRP1_9CYAN|nr:hypothetical protein [Phormidium pseudopriestleyi]MBO0349775.1 hypothetical protein [Phormidium pseudopriestleyi FRX01]